jgi:hypothetical protein
MIPAPLFVRVTDKTYLRQSDLSASARRPRIGSHIGRVQRWAATLHE